MKKIETDNFNILEFSDYKNVIGQYTNQFIKSSRCIKINETEKEVAVAVSQNSKNDICLLKLVHKGKELKSVIIKDSDFAEFIGKFVDRTTENTSAVNKEKKEYRLEDINSDSPVVNIINAICLEAIRRGASDIHIQGTKEYVDVRLRIDGVLQSIRKLEKHVFESLVSRVKVMSGLNVMENRLCQDGRMSVQLQDKKLDFRVSVVPSVSGQDIVLRLFNGEDEELTLEELGFSKENLNKLNSVLNYPYGMILATGPTGSGKTTTLHALLKKMDKDHLKIVTIEDPVEKIIDGIEQIQVNDEINFTFENILRHVLRHDPDVIMVGEIRDKETAELAVRSALTGHLILSTLHTNDSVGAVSRLKNLGIEPYLIAGTVRTVLSQRLVRKTCNDCKGKGCENCGFTGFKGRTAVSEIFEVDEKVSSMIEKEMSDAEIKNYIKSCGFKSLKEDAQLKIKDGISNKDEIMREGLV